MIRAISALCLCASIIGVRAQAQEREPPQTAEELYAEGVAALERGEAGDARAAFARAAERQPDARYVLALAATLQELGAVSEAVRHYDRLLAGDLGELDPERTAAVNRAREVARGQQAILEITFVGSTPVDIELDDTIVGSAQPGASLAFRLDPGTHRIRARIGDAVGETVEIRLATSQERRLRIEAPTALTTTRSPGAESTESPPRSSTDPGPFILLGLSAIPVGVGIAAALLFQDQLGFANAAPDHRSAHPHAVEADRFGIVANISFALGGAMITASLVWLIFNLADGG